MMRGWNYFRGTEIEGQESAEKKQEEKEKEEEEEEDRQNRENAYIAARRVKGQFELDMVGLHNLDDFDAKRLLGWAAFNEKPPDVIRKIGERCSDISGWSLRKMPALQLAVEATHVLGVRELLLMGADVNSKSDNASITTALHRAVHKASLPCVEALLEQDEIEVDAPNSVGFTPLHLCSTYARAFETSIHEEVFVNIAVLLVKRGANIVKESTAESERITPVWNAVKHGAWHVLQAMLVVGEKPPAPVAKQHLEQLRGIRDEHEKDDFDCIVDFFIEADWGPRVVDEPASRAAALRDIENALKVSPNHAPRQRSSASRAQPPSLSLHEAAKRGDVAALAEHLSSGEDVNAVDKHGGTALHAAVMHGHDGVVEALLKAHGIVVDKPDNSKLTALYRAAMADQAGAVRALLKAGASPRSMDQRGVGLLHKVVTRPAGPVLEALLDYGASPGTGGEKGRTPLHTACEVARSGTVEALLRAGALPGHCWNDGLESPLVIACRHGNLNAVQQLLPLLSPRQLNMRSGANSSAETALGAAIRCLKLSMDTVAIVEALLEAGADPHGRTGPAHLPPLALVLSTKPEFGAVNGVARDPKIGPLLVQALAAGGADVNQLAIDHRGSTPLQMASFDGACAEVIQALLDAGADVSAQYLLTGFTSPLHLAAFGGGDLRAVQLLLKQPQLGGLNAVGGLERDTPLVAAIQGGHIEVVRFLLEEGADMELLPYTEDGKTATSKSLIEMAAGYGRLDIMRLLIQAKMFKDKAEQLEEDTGAKWPKEAALC
eukprot:g8687.t2